MSLQKKINTDAQMTYCKIFTVGYVEMVKWKRPPAAFTEDSC